jgi:selenocysteine-specific elongation factor
MASPRHVVAGTAGHIDHGKSQLVRALTGIDPDRLKEEKERGITIDLGFANLVLEDGTTVGVVDVPGHERFVKNMLAGVGGIDLVLLVIAADESIMPQTREHFDICRLLNIPRGIVVLTKTDLTGADMVDLVRLEVRDFVAGSFLENAPVVAVSSRSGEGLEDLKAVLQRVAGEVPVRSESGVMRLPVDRAFSIKGFGTVVTGTLISGRIHEGDEVVLLPGGATARVRGLQVHNRSTTSASPGQRTAVNLQGVDVGAIARGDLLTTPGLLQPSRLLDVDLECLEQAPAPIKDLARVRLHHGTAEVMARVKLLEGREVAPGTQGFAQMRLERPVAALPGDRFILRRYSPALTIGGGTVLHNRPAKLRPSSAGARKRFARLADTSPSGRLVALIEEAGPAGLDTVALRSLTGFDDALSAHILEPAVASGEVTVFPTNPRRFLSSSVYDALSRDVTEALEDFHRREPLKEGLPREEIRTRLFKDSHPDVFRCVLARLSESKTIRADKDLAALATHRIALSPGETRLLDQIESRFAAAGANPPGLDEALAGLKIDPRQAEGLFHLLLSRGRLVRIPDGKVFHVQALEDLKRRLWERRAQNPRIDISEFKELSGTSRKNAIPLLEHFDQTRVTRREGNVRLILPPPAPGAASI